MRNKIISILIIIIMVLGMIPFYGIIVLAQPRIDIEVEFDNLKVGRVDGKNMVPQGGEFNLVYTFDNKEDRDIDIKIQEILEFDGGQKTSNPINVRIQAGQSQTVGGNRYNADSDDSPYRIKYTISSDGTLLEGQSSALEVIDMYFGVTYKAVFPNQVFKGQNVLYTAEVEYSGNVPVRNLTASDSRLGEIGNIGTMRPGDKKSVEKNIRLDGTTESYLVLSYDSPFGGQRITQDFRNASVKVEVMDEAPVSSLEVAVTPREIFAPQRTQVKFMFKIKNTGNVALINVESMDWNDNVILKLDKLEPGEEKTMDYTVEVEPEKSYNFTTSGTVEGSTTKTQTVSSVEVKRLDAMVEMDRTITPEFIEPGDTVTIDYVLRNTGNVALVDVVVEEPEFGQIKTFNSLSPGEEVTFEYEISSITQETFSKPIVTAKDRETGSEYRYEGAQIHIPVVIDEEAAHISILLSGEPMELESEGVVELTCILENTGIIAFTNVEVMLMERDMRLGSILSFEPGEDITFTSPLLEVEETEIFTVLVKTQDNQGIEREFLSESITIYVGKDSSSSGGRNIILRVILIIVILLIIFVAGSLIYIVKGPFKLPFGNKVKGKGKHTMKS